MTRMQRVGITRRVVLATLADLDFWRGGGGQGERWTGAKYSTCMLNADAQLQTMKRRGWGQNSHVVLLVRTR